MPRRPTPPIRITLPPEELARAQLEHARRLDYWKSGPKLLVERVGGDAGEVLNYYDHHGFGFILDDEDQHMNFAREHVWPADDGRRRFIGLFGESYVEHRHKERKETPP